MKKKAVPVIPEAPLARAGLNNKQLSFVSEQVKVAGTFRQPFLLHIAEDDLKSGTGPVRQ